MAATIIPMTIDAVRLMRLQGWLSPSFPIGAYSYSHGLEWAVETGEVRDRVALVDWLEADLRFGAARADGVFFAQAWRAVRSSLPHHMGEATASAQFPLPWEEGGGERVRFSDGARPCLTESSYPLTPWERGAGSADILAVAELAAAMRGTAEFALESGQQGVAFLAAVRKAWPHPDLDRLAGALQTAGITPVLPVAAAIACAVHGISHNLALPLYLHAGAANLINAAVRLIPLGQSDGQAALAALEEAVADTAEEALQTDISAIGSASFMIDMASMQHETQYTRLFRS